MEGRNCTLRAMTVNTPRGIFRAARGDDVPTSIDSQAYTVLGVPWTDWCKGAPARAVACDARRGDGPQGSALRGARLALGASPTRQGRESRGLGRVPLVDARRGMIEDERGNI
jgi:hypothetical protein